MSIKVKTMNNLTDDLKLIEPKKGKTESGHFILFRA